jgi:Spy/CpxP family protein refolding chaperone
MSRLGWFVLLVSLGINLGLGFRLFLDPSRESGARKERPAREKQWKPGRESGGERSWAMHRGRGRWLGQDGRPALSDTSRMRLMMEFRMEALSQRLELTDEQRASFEELHLNWGRSIIAQRVKVEEARERMFELMISSAPPTDDIRRLVRDTGRQVALLDSLITETVLKEMDYLTPEQRTRYLKFLPGMDELGPGGRRGGFGRPGGGPREK